MESFTATAVNLHTWQKCYSCGETGAQPTQQVERRVRKNPSSNANRPTQRPPLKTAPTTTFCGCR